MERGRQRRKTERGERDGGREKERDGERHKEQERERKEMESDTERKRVTPCKTSMVVYIKHL